eukprot:c14349_g1_i1.p1 GENE.c14349_g1_i1~~c14349_g1_i1.p1  ORF type:complete len:301 (-),score=53.86 c14349_g1_i1:16-918(-)
MAFSKTLLFGCFISFFLSILLWRVITNATSPPPPPPLSSFLVSVITPTSQHRHDLHARLFLHFSTQTHPNKELLVFDSGSVPSPFFSSLRDTRVTYIHQLKAFSVNAIRNILVEKSRGEFIVHFDDDDFYAPNYISQMVSNLLEHNAQFIALSGYFVYSVRDQFFGYRDQTKDSRLAVSGSPSQSVLLTRDHSEAQLRHTVLAPTHCHGFSFVYTKSLHQRIGGFSENTSIDENNQFIASIQQHPEFNSYYVHDALPIALKIFHKRSLSEGVSQYVIPSFLVGVLFGSDLVEFLRSFPIV